jgi:hypothetical protein
MGDIVAAGTGDWSTPATWVGGVAPGVGDTGVIPNLSGYVVTVDIDITCDALRNDDSGAVGYFLIDDDRTINTNIVASVSGLTPVLLINDLLAAGIDVTINGNILGSGSVGVKVTLVDNLTVIGDITANDFDALKITALPGILTVTGNITGGAAASIIGINITDIGSIIITGDLTGGSDLEAYGLYVNNSATGGMTITGDVAGGSGDASYGYNNPASNLQTVDGDVYSGTGATAIAIICSSVFPLIIDGRIIIGTCGQFPIQGMFQLVTSPANTITVYDDTPIPVVYSSSAGGASHGVILRG